MQRQEGAAQCMQQSMGGVRTQGYFSICRSSKLQRQTVEGGKPRLTMGGLVPSKRSQKSPVARVASNHGPYTGFLTGSAEAPLAIIAQMLPCRNSITQVFISVCKFQLGRGCRPAPYCRVKNWRHGQCRCSGQQFLPDETKPSISRRPSATTPRSLLSPAKTYLEAELTSEDKFWVIAASTPEELLAAATLRAQIFYSYPQVDMTLAGIEAVGARVANDLIIDDLLRTRRKSEFTRESKFEALGMRVKCLLAVCRQSSVESIGGGVATSCLLAPPPVPSIDSSSTGALVAIGTLDVQRGTKATADVNLVTFQLHAVAHRAQQRKNRVQKGRNSGTDYFPVEHEDTFDQAYIFNLGVIAAARRMGVGKALMVAALKVAKQMELQVLFVHVEEDNSGALALYKSLGYGVVEEEEEAVEVQGLLSRPRRMLLSFWLL
uniref:N-acetyltransferase domain-containing protein n=1 Tax=Physcomitrium patens TaxID=3218 RepID=A0A7I4A4T1_PHYPA